MNIVDVGNASGQFGVVFALEPFRNNVRGSRQFFPMEMFDGVGSAAEWFVANQQFENVKWRPRYVVVNKQEMGVFGVVHCFGDEIVACARNQTVVAAKLDFDGNAELVEDIEGG